MAHMAHMAHMTVSSLGVLSFHHHDKYNQVYMAVNRRNMTAKQALMNIHHLHTLTLLMINRRKAKLAGNIQFPLIPNLFRNFLLHLLLLKR